MIIQELFTNVNGSAVLYREWESNDWCEEKILFEGTNRVLVLQLRHIFVLFRDWLGGLIIYTH